MAQLNKSGKHYSIESQSSATVFGLQGFVDGHTWYIGVYLKGGPKKPSYVLNGISPAPAIQTILKVIHEDEANGKFQNISCVMMSSRMAIRLILDGTITPQDFSEAEEGTFDTSTFMEKGKVLPVIKLPKVKFGPFNFPVMIFSEVSIGSASFATLDIDGKVV